jgi:hypothetical protein
MLAVAEHRAQPCLRMLWLPLSLHGNNSAMAAGVSTASCAPELAPCVLTHWDHTSYERRHVQQPPGSHVMWQHPQAVVQGVSGLPHEPFGRLVADVAFCGANLVAASQYCTSQSVLYITGYTIAVMLPTVACMDSQQNLPWCLGA